MGKCEEKKIENVAYTMNYTSILRLLSICIGADGINSSTPDSGKLEGEI